ncbi:hypothetical protein C815_00818 [Firmicutes bacterium M10-2]|nr:hypothetical protein C815_01540 [Firmicutes bacterium M10-2]EOS61090.1 hypothetical protein C815_00818 [Firmicutes bacterium M10-2]
MTCRSSDSVLSSIQFFTFDQVIPQDHLVYKLDRAIDWSKIGQLALPLYSDKGRMAVNPVILFKMLVINIVFGYNSMRRTCTECQLNAAYRWFLGLGFDQKIPNYSTWCQNYRRRYAGTDIFEQIFQLILESCFKEGYIQLESVFGDSTHQKANANKHHYMIEQIQVAEKAYTQQLNDEINEDRADHGKKPLKEKENTELGFEEATGKEIKVQDSHEVKKSTVDPDAGLFHKGEKEKCFAYSHSIFTDRNGFVLTVETKAGNVHDSVSFFDLYEKLLNGFPFSPQLSGQIQNIVLDAGYKTPAICREILKSGRKPILPYKRSARKEGYLKKSEFVYDEEYDEYLCPGGHELYYSTTNRNGYREYKSDPEKCAECPLLEQCTHSKNHQKVITQHVWWSYVEKAEEIRHTRGTKEIYSKRKESVERTFAEVKENNGMRFTRLRGMEKNKVQALLIFACHNLKKLALWQWKNRKMAIGA